MTSWEGPYGRSSQSAPSSRKASPVLKPGANNSISTSRTPNASPSRPLAASSPRTTLSAGGYLGSSSYAKDRRSRLGSTVPDMAFRAGDDVPRARHHRCVEGSEQNDRMCDVDVKGDLKGFYENLLRGKDDIIRKLEKKVEHLHREMCCLRQTKEKEIDMLRHSAESTSRMVENEFEKRLNETMAEAEKQKVTMHRDHTRRVQELLETTNRRLQKMEESYGDRISYLTRMVDELECKLTTLSKDMEQSLILRKHLIDERDRLTNDTSILQEQNANYDQRLKEVSADYELAKDRICQLEMDKGCLEESSRKVMEDTRKHLECEIQMLREKNVEDELQCNCKLAALEQSVTSLKDNLKETEECHMQQIKELGVRNLQQSQSMELQHKKEIQEMQRDIDVLVRDYSTRVKALELSVSEKDRQVMQLKTQMQKYCKEVEEKVRREKEIVCHYESEIGDKDIKVQSLCSQLADATAERDKHLEELCHRAEDLKRHHGEEVHELNCKIQHLQRLAELQAEDSARMLEEEKRRCDEKVSKVSEQLKQSICLYEKEAHELSKQLEDERNLRCEQVRDLSEQVQQMKRLLQQQSDEYMCQVEEEKRQFRKQIQDLSKQVEQFRNMCEKQSHDYAHQLDDERRLHHEQMSQLRNQFELDHQELVKLHQKEMEALKRDPQNYVRCLEDKFTKLLTEAEDKAWEQEQCYLKKIADLESQLQQLQHDRSGTTNSHAVRRHPNEQSYDCSSLCEKDCGRMRLY